MPTALTCRTGNRSGLGVKTLAKRGFPGLVDVAEGVAGGPNGKGCMPRGLRVYTTTASEITARRDTILP